jgi:hypothetical protein
MRWASLGERIVRAGEDFQAFTIIAKGKCKVIQETYKKHDLVLKGECKLQP